MSKATEKIERMRIPGAFEMIDPEIRNTYYPHSNKHIHLFGVFGNQFFYIFYNFFRR
jgi:hypothetical protein